MNQKWYMCAYVNEITTTVLGTKSPTGKYTEVFDFLNTRCSFSMQILSTKKKKKTVQNFQASQTYILTGIRYLTATDIFSGT